ncbi:mitochondrial export translocase [Niveomyces insectorum RCEF 264]|uniref:Mitochondrial export translocase n=1 Tax=Niveomyces insectorum RCEF 264 TaxID=1081102 RepID=A0A167Y6Q9_9HYPO|nr:mitochondrial export translocase [Niveomyces insectorum RCEF 264]
MFARKALVRPAQAMRLRQAIVVSPCTRTGCVRNFGTVLRSRRDGAAVSISQLSGRRITSSTTTTATTHHSFPPSSAAAFSLFPWSSSKKSAALPADDLAASGATSPSPAPSSSSSSFASSSPPQPPAPSSPASSLNTAPQTADAASLSANPSPSLSPLGGSSGSGDGVDAASTVADLLDGSALLDLPEQIGYLKTLGLDFGWGPTSICEWLLEHLHVSAGLPWWMSILGAVLLFRAAIFFPSLTAAEHSAKFQQLRQNPAYMAATKEMQQAALQGGAAGQGRAMELRATTQRLQRQAGASLWKTFIPLVNVPFGYGMFRLLRSMATLPVPGWESSGLLWFHDFSVPDPYFVLPLASAGIMFLIFRINIVYMSPEQAQVMKLVQIVLTPVTILITVKMSAAVAAQLEPIVEGGDGAPAAAAPPKPGPPSTIDLVKKGWNKMTGTAKESKGQAHNRQSVQKAQEYEKRRALEDEENLYRRREAQRRYRELKKSVANKDGDAWKR